MVGGAVGGSALCALCSFTSLAFARGAGVGAAGGELNCANFGIFLINLCSWSINSASLGKESTIFGSGWRSRPSNPRRSTKGAGAWFGVLAVSGASVLTSGPVPFNHDTSTRYCGVRKNEAGRLLGRKKSDDNLFGRFIGSPSFITINTATIVFPWSTQKSSSKKNSDLLE